jgi:putative Mn2+ efflux pump MntP
MIFSTGVAAFLIALSCNLDNVGVGISYGTRRIRLPLITNFYIALLTAFGTWLAMIKLPVLATTLAVGILSVLTFWLGIAISRFPGGPLPVHLDLGYLRPDSYRHRFLWKWLLPCLLRTNLLI